MPPLRSALSLLASAGRITIDGALRSLATAYLLHVSRCQVEELLCDMERARVRATATTTNNNKGH